MDRRQFVKRLAMGAGATGLCGLFWIEDSGKLHEVPLPEEFRDIDHNHHTHAIRDGRAFPRPAPSDKYDVVVIGGGISGMTTAWHLQGVRTLVLEKEAWFGGNSRRLRAAGIEYPLGALLSQGAEAPFTSFFQELGVEFEKIESPHFSLEWNGRIVDDPFGKGAAALRAPGEVRLDFARLGDSLRPMLDPANGINFPKAGNRSEISALNDITLASKLDSMGVGPEVRKVLDLLLSSRLGETSATVSAWEGLYVLARTVVADQYTLPGGHGAVSDRLSATLRARQDVTMSPNSTVVSIEESPGKPARVTWVDSLTREAKCVEARQVVVASPKLIGKYMVNPLSDAKRQAMASIRYTPFLVAQVFLDEPVMETFEIGAPDRFTKFMVRPDWISGNRSPEGRSHLTAYIPFLGPDGRRNLLEQPPVVWAKSVRDDLEDVLGRGFRHVTGMHLHRWGHPMMIPVPGQDASIREASAASESVVWAHSDSYGICGLYSAVWTGMDAWSEVAMRLS